MSDTVVRAILVSLTVLAFAQEAWDATHSRTVSAEIVDIERDEDHQGNTERVIVFEYTDPDTGISRRDKFQPNPPADWLYGVIHGPSRTGDTVEMSRILESGLMPGFQYSPWYCTFHKSLGFGLLALLGLLMPIGESKMGGFPW